MSKTSHKIVTGTIPSAEDDMNVRYIRMSGSKKEKEFMMNDPRFTPEAMKKRSHTRSLALRRKSQKQILEKFGK